jgi:hypothetical protein
MSVCRRTLADLRGRSSRAPSPARLRVTGGSYLHHEESLDIPYCTAIVTVFDDTPPALRLNETLAPGVTVVGTSALT